MNAARSDDVDESSTPEGEERFPSRRRVVLLCILLLLVAGIGVRHLITRPLGRGIGESISREIGAYLGRGGKASIPATAPTGVPPSQEASSTSAGSSVPAVPAPPAKPHGVAGSRVASEGSPAVKPPSAKTRVEEAVRSRSERSGEPRKRLAAKEGPNGRYSVQVAAMAHEANAVALRRKLETLGYEVTIRERQASPIEHIVLVESPRDKTEADALVERLKVDGIQAALVESNGRFRVEVGRSAVLDQAIDLAHELQKRGFTPKIVSEPESKTLYLVRVGEFASRREAVKSANELREKGFQAILVEK